MPTLNRARILELAGLSRRRERARLGRFLVEGIRGVEAAVAAGGALEGILVTAEAAATPRVAAIVEAAAAPIWRIPARDLDRVGDAQTAPGIIAVAMSVVGDFEGTAPPVGRVVALDGVQDPGNVGTIIRTAAWFGMDAVLLGPGTADPESPKVARAAAGALWDVRLLRTSDLVSTLALLVGAGRAVYGADAGGEPVHGWRPDPHSILCLGSEASGLAAATRRTVKSYVAVPKAGRGAGVESLNVAVAAGILMARWADVTG